MDYLSRKKALIEFISEKHSARLQEIADHCAVSPMTIRRDLVMLEDQGFLTINRGVVYLNSGTTLELSSTLKNNQMLKEKKRIAKRAFSFVSEGSTIFLDCGTTIRELVYEIIQMKNITVVTNSLLVINILSNFPNITCLIASGTFNRKGMGFFDATTCSYLRHINVDTAFLGLEAADPEIGCMVPGIDDAECKKVICQNAAKIIVLTDSSKLGKRSLVCYGNFDQIDMLITDKKCSTEFTESISKKKTEIIIS